MKDIGARRAAIIGLAIVAGSTGFTLPASAGSLFTIDVVQEGSNVVASGSGSIDLTGLTEDFSGTSAALTAPGSAALYVGPTSGISVIAYSGISGPTNFGSGLSGEAASTGGGELAGVCGGGICSPGALEIEEGYTSGSALSDTATWDNATFASLGLTAGTYTWTWDGGMNSLVVDIGTPEPASLMLFGAALFGLGAARRRTM